MRRTSARLPELRAVLAGQLGIEAGPELRQLEGRILRQDSQLAYRAVRRDAGDDIGQPVTRYVDSGGIHIACQVLGAGERDIVFVPGAMSHLDLLWEDPETAAFFRRLSTLGRLILFDKRDTGLSDRAPADSPVEERIEDVRAVMGAASSSEAVLFGYSEGAPMSILFAATHPERVTALILGAATARYPWAPSLGARLSVRAGADEMFDALAEIAARRWGQGTTIEWFLPSRAASPRGPPAVRAFRADGGEPERVSAHYPDDPPDRCPLGPARHPRANAGNPASRRPHDAPLPRALPGLPHRGRPLL
jgi:pimeloyl-ACP methyl ester carboxylesterase